jgi:hypothetical protein
MGVRKGSASHSARLERSDDMKEILAAFR